MTAPFWILVAFTIFAFVGFPLVVLLLGAIMRRGYASGPVTPAVDVLIAAYNEAEGIEAKIRNALEQRYPTDRLRVVVVDDGSTDGTPERVEALADARVTLVRGTARGGKIGALNAGIAACTAEVVLLTDANSDFEPDAVARLVEPFADPAVGGVCGNQQNRRGKGALALGETLYWEYDKLLKRMETRTGSIVAADGSIYAIRRDLWETIPKGVTDDFFVSTGVVAAGRRLVFAESARAIEAPLERGGDHYRRRVRITQQAMHSLAMRRSLMNPARHGVYALVLVGHKVLRRLASPAIFLCLPATVLALPGGWLYALALLAQISVYVLAALGWWGGGRLPAKILAAPYYFVLGNLATTVGMIR
jgi:cellulose synthase/poly-beta-1,6-N-acetylglucosamine synthase-like glycosyltransferase